MKKYLITGIDEKFWRKVKILSATRGITVKELILTLLKKEIEGSDDV